MKLEYYLTYNHPKTHHQSIQKTYLINATIAVQECILQECAKTRPSDLDNTGINPNLGRDDRLMNHNMGARLAEFHTFIKLIIILLSNVNMSISIANGGQNLQQFLGKTWLLELLIRIISMTLMMVHCRTLINM